MCTYIYVKINKRWLPSRRIRTRIYTDRKALWSSPTKRCDCSRITEKTPQGRWVAGTQNILKWNLNSMFVSLETFFRTENPPPPPPPPLPNKKSMAFSNIGLVAPTVPGGNAPNRCMESKTSAGRSDPKPFKIPNEPLECFMWKLQQFQLDAAP